jgi:lipopolysaccharide biosynthesis protein
VLKISPKASVSDVVYAHRAILGRNPRSESETHQYVNKSRERLIVSLLMSDEFATEIFAPVAAGQFWRKEIFEGNLDDSIRLWILRVFKLEDDGGQTIINSSEWLSILTELYKDGSLLRKSRIYSWNDANIFNSGLATLKAKAPDFCGVLDIFDGTYISGWAFDPYRPETPATVDFFLNDTLIHSVLATDERSDVRVAGIHSEPCGFRTKVPQEAPDMVNQLLEARVRGSGRALVGSPKLGVRPKMLQVARQDQAAELDPAYQAIQDKLPDMFYKRMLAPNGKIAVVLHLFYPELWKELRAYLENITETFDLFVSLVIGKSDHAEKIILADYPDARIAIFPNHGRDVFPFSEFANSGMLDSYELICKIHGKRSLHRRDGEAWRQSLFGGLLGSKEIVDTICRKMRDDPDIGLVVPDGYIYEADALGDNIEGLSKLLARVDLVADFGNLTFPAGNMFWIPQSSFQWLKALQLSCGDFELEDGQLDATIGHAVERYIGIACEAAHQKQLTTSDVLAIDAPDYHGERHTLIAFYLPQYHPIPENDAFWGKGFTEWHNVSPAKQQFAGHNQPRRPTELGYYDLRLDEIRHQQADLAKTFGVNAFCYYYYWFDGKPVMTTPLDKLVGDKSLDFPFCICWANENWTRSWDGMQRDVLMPQSYDPDLLSQFAEDVTPYLADERYLRHNGKPFFVVYKISDIPEPVDIIAGWRETWARNGVGDVHVAVVRTFDAVRYPTPLDLGVDSFIDFPPHSITPFAKPADVVANADFEGFAYDYVGAMEGDLARYEQEDSSFVHRGVMAAWDNTARRGNKAHIAHRASPMTYRSWLRASLIQDARRNPTGDRLMFINAWNEWAEGTYLEPDARYGRAFLEATRSART